MRLARPLSVALVSVLAVPLTSGPARSVAVATPTQGYVTMVETPGGPITHGQALTLASDLAVAGTASAVTVTEGGGTTVVLAAPIGQQLSPGLYTDATGDGAGGHPLLHVTRGSEPCASITGRFTIHQITTDADGNVTALDASYEQHCDAGTDAVLGEVRVGLPAGDLLPVRADFAEPEPFEPATPTPFVLRNDSDGPLAVTGVASSSDAFALVSDTCTGVVEAHATCRVGVAFEPGAPGPASGTLTVSTDQGDRTADLTGRQLVGASGAEVTNEATGTTTSLPTPGSPMIVNEVAGVVEVRFPFTFGNVWQGLFSAGPDKQLAEGVYRSYEPSGAAMDVQCSSQGRGMFAVDDLEREDGRIVRLSLTFQQWCGETSKALRGHIDYRARTVGEIPAHDDTPPSGLGAVLATGVGANVLLDWSLPPALDYFHAQVRITNGTTPPATSSQGSLVGTPEAASYLVKVEPHKDYAFALFPTDFAGNVGPPSGAVIRGTDLSLDAPRPITAGSKAHLTGSLIVLSTRKPPTGGAQLTLYQRAHGSRSWVNARLVYVDSAGRFSTYVNPSGNVDYYLAFRGGTGVTGSQSTVGVVRVAPHVVLTPASSTVRRGTKVVLAVRTSPVTPGASCQLQKHVGTTWVRAGTSKTTSHGECAFAPSTSSVGTAVYRVLTGPTTGHDAGTSSWAVIRST